MCWNYIYKIGNLWIAPLPPPTAETTNQSLEMTDKHFSITDRSFLSIGILSS